MSREGEPYLVTYCRSSFPFALQLRATRSGENHGWEEPLNTSGTHFEPSRSDDALSAEIAGVKSVCGISHNARTKRKLSPVRSPLRTCAADGSKQGHLTRLPRVVELAQ